MKILVIQQKMIGDVLTSSILFEALRNKYPDAELHYLINTHTYPVVENHPFIDEFIFFKPEIESSKAKLFKLAKSIRKERYEVVIDVYSKLSSNVVSLLSGAETKISYYKHYSAFVYNHNIIRKSETDKNSGLAIVNRMQLLEPLGIAYKEIKPKIYITNTEIEDAKNLLESHNISLSRPLFMVGVLGSGPNKTYPHNYMAQIIDGIVAKTQGQILFNYIPNQTNEAQAIFNTCKPETQQHIYFDAFGKNLREFLAIAIHCNAIIGNEGGAINMAKALNISTFAIFSPWIDKNTWSIFEDDKKHVSIHLKDLKPELFEKKSVKTIKKEAFSLYNSFTPELILPKLTTYLQQF